MFYFAVLALPTGIVYLVSYHGEGHRTHPWNYSVPVANAPADWNWQVTRLMPNQAVAVFRAEIIPLFGTIDEEFLYHSIQQSRWKRDQEIAIEQIRRSLRFEISRAVQKLVAKIVNLVSDLPKSFRRDFERFLDDSIPEVHFTSSFGRAWSYSRSDSTHRKRSLSKTTAVAVERILRRSMNQLIIFFQTRHNWDLLHTECLFADRCFKSKITVWGPFSRVHDPLLKSITVHCGFSETWPTMYLSEALGQLKPIADAVSTRVIQFMNERVQSWKCLVQRLSVILSILWGELTSLQ